MTARDLAHRAFWTEHPLTQLYALAHGHWTAGRYVPADKWSIRQLITFAETLPAHVIEALDDGSSFVTGLSDAAPGEQMP